MIAIIEPERTLSRWEYWKRILLMFLTFFILGAWFADLPDEEFLVLQGFCNLVGWVFGVYWGRARCRDAGWHPGWAFLNFTMVSFIIFGCPGPKKEVELRLAT